MATTTTARSPLPADVAKRFAGQWIAMRGGKVIASADNFGALLKQRGVRRDDAFFKVPSASTYYF